MSASATKPIQRDSTQQTEKRLELIRRFTLAGFADTTTFEHVPPGAMLFLLPDDDDEFVEVELGVGAQAAKRGEDVLFRHVRVADLPD